MRVVVFGTGLSASVGRYYLDQVPGTRVVAFTADGEYVREPTFEGLPLVPFEELAGRFPPDEVGVAVRIGATAINGLRAAKAAQASAAGYRLVRYRHPSAQVAGNVVLGPNTFVQENAVIHPFARVGWNVTVGSGSVIGHHASVGDHVFLASNVSILGFAALEERSFVGANAVVCEGTVVGRAAFVGAGVVVGRDAEPESVLVSGEPQRLPRPSTVLSPWLVRRRVAR